MQDELGAMNDAHVAAGRARDTLVRRADSITAAERVAVAGYFARRERDALRRRRPARATWRTVAGARFRRSLGRAIAGL
jgi:hypothetical protein